LSNQPPADPDQPWTRPEETPGQPSPDSPTSALPVSGNPWSSPSGDALAAEPYQAPATAEPATEVPGYQPPAAPAFRPGSAPLPPPPEPQPLSPTSMFPQAPASAPGGSQGGYPPQPDPYQPYPHAYSQPPAGYGPPAGYAPPPGYGQPPGYGPPPGHGQPAPGYGQPQRPPKRSNVPIIAVILAVALLLCAGVVTAGVVAFNAAKHRAEEALKPITDPAFPTEIPNLPDPNATAKKITVTYEVTGDGPVSIVYLEKIGGSPKHLDNVTLPWKFETTMEGATLISVTAIRSGTDPGTISCRATVDGAQVAQRTQTGTFATASCTKMVF
jgi:hypothetical protein